MTKPFGTDIPSSTSAGLRTVEVLDEASRVMQMQQAEIERLRADAERYRWLRDHGVAYAICKYESGGPGEHDWCGWLPFDTRSTDAAIDAAMKEEK